MDFVLHSIGSCPCAPHDHPSNHSVWSCDDTDNHLKLEEAQAYMHTFQSQARACAARGKAIGLSVVHKNHQI
jgi:hypothetical protein